MNTIFTDLVATGKVAVYLDDILIYSSMPIQHQDTTHEVLRHLHAHDLYLQLEKCEFNRNKIKYLGLIIKEGEVSMDPVKVKAVMDWLAPKNLRELRGFLRFTNFYHRFIKDFSRLAQPLYDFTKKDTYWTWNANQQQAFQALKEKFLQKHILVVWEPNRPTHLKVDASGYATSRVLLQKLDNDRWHPVAFRSQSMIEAERNYEIYDKEMLAIIRTLEDWQHYLKGLP